MESLIAINWPLGQTTQFWILVFRTHGIIGLFVSLNFVWQSVHEANGFYSNCKGNSAPKLSILKNLRFRGFPWKASRIKSIV